MERKEWLESLKVGDKVFVTSRWNEQIRTIEKITPTRRFKIGTSTFNSNGHEMDVDSWSGSVMHQVTQEVEEKIRRRNIIAYLGKNDWSKCSTDQLEEIIKLIKG